MELKDVNNLKVNVYATMAYFDVFDYPLKIDELERFLLWASMDRRALWSFLNNDPGIQRNGDYYFFRGRREIVEARKNKEKLARRLWRKVHGFVPMLKAVPYVKMVAVCNSLAINNTADGSDIDLFIVAKKGRLFSARTFTTLLFSLLAVRRHGKKVRGRFCLSFFAADDSLDMRTIRKDEDDIYLPYWILTLRPVFGNEIYLKMMRENAWIGSYFPHRDFVTADNAALKPEVGVLAGVARFKEKLLNGKAGDRLEKWLAAKHLERHQRRLSTLGPDASVIVSEKMLKFHNRDRRKEISEKFAKRFKEVCAEAAE